MKKICTIAGCVLAFCLASSASADDWSGAVAVSAIVMDPGGNFNIVAPNAPHPSACGDVYKVATGYASVTSLGLEMLHRQAVSALIGEKSVSMYWITGCWVSHIQLND